MSKRIELIKKFVFSNNAVATQPMGAGYSGKLGPITGQYPGHVTCMDQSGGELR